MASLHLTSSPSFNQITPRKQNQTILPPHNSSSSSLQLMNKGTSSRSRLSCIVQSYKVIVEHQGETTELEVDPNETILSKALESGMDVPHDCKLGVCMTCPARLLRGTVDQSDGMLSDDVVERGYALLCAAYPTSDCHIKIIPEEELLSLQLATAND